MRDFVSIVKLEARILFELGTTDRYIMGNKKRKALKNRVNLQWWSYPSDGLQNVGDLLSPVVVDCILKNKGLSLESRCARTSNLVAIGSVLGNYAQKAVVWGSGAFSSSTNRRLKMSKYDIRAVRGPLTRKTLIFSCLNSTVRPSRFMMVSTMLPILSSSFFLLRRFPAASCGFAWFMRSVSTRSTPCFPQYVVVGDVRKVNI